MQYYSIEKEKWDEELSHLLVSHTIFANINNGSGTDYEITGPENIHEILYNGPRPVTSLKSFFLPVRENVTAEKALKNPRIIIGIPNCDIEGLKLLDTIYLDGEYNDIFYKERRENTIMISSDCFESHESCHCTAYGFNPFTTATADMAALLLGNKIILRVISPKGEEFVKQISSVRIGIDEGLPDEINRLHSEIKDSFKKKLPGYRETGALIIKIDKKRWEKYSFSCVSCGACTSVCPTCSCFLLIDKPGFEKLRQMDACQYPGFERVAGGEDALFELPVRFSNRFLCKYVWKPGKFNSIACTGCGRCIDACIGKINKNEVFAGISEKSDA